MAHMAPRWFCSLKVALAHTGGWGEGGVHVQICKAGESCSVAFSVPASLVGFIQGTGAGDLCKRKRDLRPKKKLWDHSSA